jgi:hypothetical protein
MSEKPTNGESIHWGSSLIITNLWVGFGDERIQEVIFREFWWNLLQVEIWDCNREKLIKVLLPSDIFDMELFNDPNWLPCDF